MAQYDNLQNTDIGKVETFDLQGMINKALIGIMISKEIIVTDRPNEATHDRPNRATFKWPFSGFGRG